MVRLARFDGLSRVAGLAHGVTERQGGVSGGAYSSLNHGRGSGDDPESVAENGRRLADVLGATGPIRFPRQVHGTSVVVLEDPARTVLGEADAVVTSLPGVAVGVLGADCPGVLIVDPVQRALGVAHAGWRGTLAGVVRATVAALVSRFGSVPEDCLAAIGPGISAPRFEVGPEVADAFRAGFPGSDRCLSPGRGDRSHLDLALALRLQLEAAGVPPSAIETTGLCTFDERERFFSHRRDGAATGRHALVAMWRA